jgi:hypothetical protein
MIIDVTGTILIPGNNGYNCFGNGEHFDESGKRIEICCDECDYYLCCMEEHDMELCKTCMDDECLHSLKNC